MRKYQLNVPFVFFCEELSADAKLESAGLDAMFSRDGSDVNDVGVYAHFWKHLTGDVQLSAYQVHLEG